MQEKISVLIRDGATIKTMIDHLSKLPKEFENYEITGSFMLYFWKPEEEEKEENNG